MTTGSSIEYPLLGQCRSVVEPGKMALLPKAFREYSVLPAFSKVQAQVLVTTRMGAQIVHYELVMQPGGGTVKPIQEEFEHTLYVLEGSVELGLRDGRHSMGVGGYAWLPPQTQFTLKNEADSVSRVLWLRRRYEKAEGYPIPDVIVANERDVPGTPESPNFAPKYLLPFDKNLGFDMAFNLLSFRPGQAFPCSEAHVYEHSIYVVSGWGIVWINGTYYEVHPEDLLYMAPFVPHFACGHGTEDLRYVLYKDVNRDYGNELRSLK